MRLISFSLFGHDTKYSQGAIRNAERVREIPGDWRAIFYIGSEVDSLVEESLRSLGAYIVKQENSWHSNGMFWRFKVIHDFEFEHALIRDVDSHLSLRELSAVDAWISSGKMFHIMRDHPYHNALILGGLWGTTSAIRSLPINWGSAANYGNEIGEDQRFLANEVYPLVRSNCLIHDTFFSKPHSQFAFPVTRKDSEYVGESYNERGEFDAYLREVLESSEHSRISRTISYLKFRMSRFKK